MIRSLATIGLLLVAQAPAFGLAVAAAPAAAGAALAGAHAQVLPQPTGATLTPNYRDALYGDFVQVGNSVLRCPADGEETGGNPAADCIAATDNDTPGGLLDNRSNNNGYFMHWADEGSGDDPDVFDSSRAEVLIPEGATVRYAQLHWGGHTGAFVGFSGVNCTRPLLLQGQPPPSPAAVSPDQQAVRLAVDGGAPETVRRVAGHYRTTTGLAEPSEMYTDWADVTDLLADAPTGRLFDVTVSNVWAPSGPGCAGGWSLVVVFGYDEPREPDFTSIRVIDLYTDNLPKGGVLLPGIIEPLVPGFPSVIDGLLPGLLPGLTGSSVVLPGVSPDPAAAGVTIGVTAYDGDWNQGGDTLSVDGVEATDPCLNDDSVDFFRSCANGAIDPTDPARRPQNNLSVDSKTFMPELPDDADGNLELRVDSLADFFVLQNVVLTETADPAVSVSVDGPDEVEFGEFAEFTVEVTNTGSLPLFDIDFTDTSDPPSGGITCTPATVQPLAPGQSRFVTCVQAALASDSFTNTASVTATYVRPTDGSPARTVSAEASKTVQVQTPDYALARVPDKLVTHVGEAVTFTVTALNNTDGALTNVIYTDDAADECDGAPDGIAPRSQVTFECVVSSPAETFESGGTLTATLEDGSGIEVPSQLVTVTVIEPALVVELTVDKDMIYQGDTVTATIEVTNAGDEPDETVSAIDVSVDNLADCEPDPIPELAPDETATVTCTSNPERTVQARAVAVGTDVTDEPVAGGSDPVTITVLEAPLAITQEADRSIVRVENTDVTFTFTVTNTRDPEDPDAAPLRDVQIGNPTIPLCEPEVIEQLDPGQSETRTCTAGPDRTFDSIAFATAVDELDRPMRVESAPLRITVINPVMTIATKVEPEEAQHGEDVEFTVTVRNIGDVPLDLEVTNDEADDCDFTITGSGLPAGAAQGRRCQATTPTSESEQEFTNTAAFAAHPAEEFDDDGEAITGEDLATVTLQAGQAPTTTPNPGSGDDGDDGGSGSGSGNGGGGDTGGGGSGSSDNLAKTGSSITVPIVLAAGMLVTGALMLVVAARREDVDGDDDSFLSRWWPGN